MASHMMAGTLTQRIRELLSPNRETLGTQSRRLGILTVVVFIVGVLAASLVVAGFISLVAYYAIAALKQKESQTTRCAENEQLTLASFF